MQNFLIELVKRFMADTPWFFRVVRTLGIVVALVTGLPGLLEGSGLDLPAAWDAIASKAVSIAAIVGSFIAQLTATSANKKELNFPD